MKRTITLFILLFFYYSSIQAQYADLGSSQLQSKIWWFDWNGFNMQNGANRTFTTADGLQVTITVSGVQGPIPVPDIMNTWPGAVLHFLFDFSDPTIKPALFCGNTLNNTYFTMDITATRNGQPAPFTFVGADAEASNPPEEELTTLTTNGGNWSTLEFFRNSTQTNNPVVNCGTQSITIEDTYGGIISPITGTPVGQNPVMATDAPASGKLHVTVAMTKTAQGGMAVAFGIFAPIDRGDLPSSYGYARHQLTYTRNNSCNYLPPLPSLGQNTSLILGAVPPDADGQDNVDDNLSGADEDAITSFPDYTGNGTYNLDVPLVNTTGSDAYLAGWFDYNRNSSFETNENVLVTVPANTTTARLSWTGLPAQFTTGNGAPFGIRLRLSSDKNALQTPIGIAIDGEVEDYLARINAPCAVTILQPSTAVCEGTPVQFQASGGVTYNWSPATGLSSATIANPVATPATTTTYTVTGTDAGGCAGTATAQLTVNTVPDITVRPDTTICVGGSVTLATNASNTISYSWTPAASLNNATAAAPIATPSQTTQYTVTATAPGGCTKTASVNLTVLPQPTYTFNSISASLCLGDTLNMTASGGDIYEWTENGTVVSNAPQHNVVATLNTNYGLTITDNTCNITRSYQLPVTVNSLPITSVTSSNNVDCSHGVSLLQATGGVKYQWVSEPGIKDTLVANPKVIPLLSTTYYVKVTDANGCANIDSVTVLVDLTQSLSVYPIPSAFSPNGDGKNDCFGLKYWGAVKTLEFNIYDRWGVLLFSTNDPTACWDGTYKGILQPVGAYVFLIKAETLCGNVFRKGTVTLVR